ncbi:MAG TPA: NFACT RNA binding domain-containing protein [Terriglobales bacterium]|nr:NFACT RNA binding domain-containing protein [Terriglobales bacterium]
MAKLGPDGRPVTDADRGIWQGRSIARRFVSADGMVVLVGKTADDNDLLSLRLGDGRDFWMHISGDSGSHVVVRNPDNLDQLPKETLMFAAGLAARYSKARNARRVPVHVARCADVSKPANFEPGKVLLRRYTTVHAVPVDPTGTLSSS